MMRRGVVTVGEGGGAIVVVRRWVEGRVVEEASGGGGGDERYEGERRLSDVSEGVLTEEWSCL